MRAKSNVEKFILCGVVAGGIAVAAATGAMALPLQRDAGCRAPGVMNAAATERGSGCGAM